MCYFTPSHVNTNYCYKWQNKGKIIAKKWQIIFLLFERNIFEAVGLGDRVVHNLPHEAEPEERQQPGDQLHRRRRRGR